MVYAESEEQVESLYNAMISEIDANQAAAIEAIYTEKYTSQMDLWNRLNVNRLTADTKS
mgnify:CR=1 FL=1